MFEALLKLNENSMLGSFLDEVEQQELLIETPVTSEEIRLKRLIGNEHSNPNQKQKQLLDKIPNRSLPGGYEQYLLNGRWWTRPRWTPSANLEPLDYTGSYDEWGFRWVNHDGKRQRWDKRAGGWKEYIEDSLNGLWNLGQYLFSKFPLSLGPTIEVNQ